jgi:hypothetical protein
LVSLNIRNGIILDNSALAITLYKNKMPRSLASRFIDSFLDKHIRYLKSIHDVIVTLYRSKDGVRKGILDEISVDKAYFDEIKVSWNGNEKKAFLNLRNAWYHECALGYPFGADEDNVKARMKFASWKIVQFYYAVYTAASAIVRCYYSPDKLNHEKALRILTNNFIKHPKLGINFFIPPFGIYARNEEVIPSCKDAISWEYGKTHHCPNIEEALLSSCKIRRDENITLLHYFKDLREWINYEDAYLLIRLYGPYIIRDLDKSLYEISNAFNMLSEIFLINFYGSEKVFAEFEGFTKEVKNNLEIDPDFLNKRFELYKTFPKGLGKV